MPHRSLRVLAPTRYPWRFNGPRHSAHAIENRNFAPLNYVHKSLEGMTLFNPYPPRAFDLVHAFNRIPLGFTPFVIGFESHLPRGFGLEESRYYRQMTKLLASDRCRGIVAISHHARRTFEHTHRNSPYREVLQRKLSVRYPNLEVPSAPPDLTYTAGEPFVLSFVGNHFARKGGCVAVRVAEMALEKRLPLRVEIVSSLQVGREVWTDPLNPAFFDTYRTLLDLPNVRWHRALSNAAVHDLFRRSHMSLLTTFCDTFGYSAVESMIHGTPVIATRQGALPEFIADGRNGVLVDLETGADGEWVHIAHPDRASREYEAIVASGIERMAASVVEGIARCIEDPHHLAALRRNAWLDARRQFSAEAASTFWDQFYRDALDARNVGNGQLTWHS